MNRISKAKKRSSNGGGKVKYKHGRPVYTAKRKKAPEH